MQDHLRIAVGSKDMPFALQLRPEVEEVIQLAVVDDAAGMIFVPDRLLAASKIDNAEPAHPEKDVFVLP